MRAATALSVLIAAGAAHAADKPLKPWPVANIDYNARTGERTASPLGAHTRNLGSRFWVNDNTDPCGTGPENGIVKPCCGGASILFIDNPDFDGDTLPDYTGPGAIPPELNPPPEGAWVLDWGDIGADTVIDCVVLAYATTLPDTDTDGDSIGDGITGYDMSITFSDADNGHDSDRYCILGLTLTDLPGVLPTMPPGSVAVYSITLNFSSIAQSYIFELGDADGEDRVCSGLNGGSLFGHPTYADLDGDGRHDFSFAVRFDQSEIPPERRGLSGVVLAGPSEFAPGAEDALDLFASGPDCPPDQAASYLGSFDLGGHSCAPGAQRPFASVFLELSGPSGNGCYPCGACTAADYAAPAGVLDFSDVLEFIQAFAGGHFCADLAAPFNTFNFDDVAAFLTAFGQGCP